MEGPEVFRTCSQCGSQDVPTLIVSSARHYEDGSIWQCRSCHHRWSDHWSDAEYGRAS